MFAAPLSWALYTSSDDVIELNDRNFETRVLKSDELWIVEFYAPWYEDYDYESID